MKDLIKFVILGEFKLNSMQPGVVKLKEIKPALYGYARDAQSMLSPGELPGERIVHDVRVLMKKSRAAIKLLRPQVDEDIINREYFTFRETGRLMRSWRESCVHRKTLRALKKKYPAVFNGLEGNPLIENVLKDEELSVENNLRIKEDLERIMELIKKSGYRLRFMKLDNIDPDQLFRELESTYISVGKCFMLARNIVKPRNLHEFRKRAKDFLYQLYFFRQINPKVIKGLEKRLDSMTQNLGKYNDLVVLVNLLGYKYGKSPSDFNLDELILIIRQEQDKFLSKVWPAAYKIFNPGQSLTTLLGFQTLSF
jgi:CHAD domain-containing protein